jgi:hypothetical protein
MVIDNFQKTNLEDIAKHSIYRGVPLLQGQSSERILHGKNLLYQNSDE